MNKKGVTLGKICNINQGLVSGAPRVSAKSINLLPEKIVRDNNIKVDDGIFVLTRTELKSLNFPDREKDIIKPYFRQTQIDPYFAEKENNLFVIYTTKDADLEKYQNIKTHLERFQPILENRLRVYGEDYPWYKLHRERNQEIFEMEKIVTPNFARHNTFAYVSYPFYTEFDVYYLIPQVKELSLKYLLAILNSSLLDFWVLHNAKLKGEKKNVREYNTGSIRQIPVTCIDFNNSKEVKIHDTLVKKVEAMIETKKRLADFNNFFKTRLTRLEDPKDIPEPDAYAITRTLLASDLRVLRTHPKVQIEAKDTDDFYLAKVGEIKGATLFSKPTEEGQYSIKLIGKNKKQIAITAPKEIIYYLKDVLSDHIGKSLDEIKEIPLAKDLETYEAKRDEILKEAKKLMTKVKSLQSEIDEIVYELYGITQAERKIIEKELQSK
jgi:hypothetical protein